MSDQPQEHTTHVGNGADNTPSMYDRICQALDTEQQTNETAEEFKIRVVNEFSDMTRWPDTKYETLAQDIQNWVYEATMTHKGNNTKKRKKAMPDLSGLDPAPVEKKKRGRASLVDEPKRGRTRSTGDDCLTRTMKLLVVEDKPEDLKADDLLVTLKSKYGKEYSKAAVRYAQQAFVTARNLIEQNASA